MKIEIVKVVKSDYEEIETNEKYMNRYRRYGPDHWCHKLGVYGWHRYMGPDLLEEAYQRWVRKNATNTKGINT